MKESELPPHIGGYQHIVGCPIEDGDIWVSEGRPNCVVYDEWFGQPAPENVIGFRIYRKIEVPRQGGSGYPDNRPAVHPSSMNR